MRSYDWYRSYLLGCDRCPALWGVAGWLRKVANARIWGGWRPALVCPRQTRKLESNIGHATPPNSFRWYSATPLPACRAGQEGASGWLRDAGVTSWDPNGWNWCDPNTRRDTDRRIDQRGRNHERAIFYNVNMILLHLLHLDHLLHLAFWNW